MEWFSLLEGGEPVGSPALSSLLMDAWLGYQRTVGPWGICQDSHGWHITASASVMSLPWACAQSWAWVMSHLMTGSEPAWFRSIPARFYLWVVSQPPKQTLGIKIPPRMQPPSHGSPQTSLPGHCMSQFSWQSWLRAYDSGLINCDSFHFQHSLSLYDELCGHFTVDLHIAKPNGHF